MIRLGGRYTPVRRGPRGIKGTPGVTAQAKDDGSLEIAPTGDQTAPPAVAPPPAPDTGNYTLTAVDGALTWTEVVP